MIIARTTNKDSIGQGEIRDPEDCCLKRRGSYLRCSRSASASRRVLFTPATFASACRTELAITCRTCRRIETRAGPPSVSEAATISTPTLPTCGAATAHTQSRNRARLPCPREHECGSRHARRDAPARRQTRVRCRRRAVSRAAESSNPRLAGLSSPRATYSSPPRSRTAAIPAIPRSRAMIAIDRLPRYAYTGPAGPARSPTSETMISGRPARSSCGCGIDWAER